MFTAATASDLMPGQRLKCWFERVRTAQRRAFDLALQPPAAAAGAPLISSNDSRRPLRRFESVGSVIAMAYQGDFASDFWRLPTSLRAKSRASRDDPSSEQSVPYSSFGMNATTSATRNAEALWADCCRLCCLNAYASAEIQGKSLHSQSSIILK